MVQDYNVRNFLSSRVMNSSREMFVVRQRTKRCKKVGDTDYLSLLFQLLFNAQEPDLSTDSLSKPRKLQ